MPADLNPSFHVTSDFFLGGGEGGGVLPLGKLPININI